MNCSFRRIGGWVVVGLVCLAETLAAAPEFVRDAELVDRVIDLIDRRLAIMPEVAAIKYRQQKPVADPARESVVLDQSVSEARALQLDADAARAFFSLQIQMARRVQERLLADWKARAVEPPAARDLVKEIRPELDALGRELLPAVYLASPVLVEVPAADLRAKLARLERHAGTSEAQRAELARALGALRITATPTWATLQRVGVLRVATTGDYAPFSEERAGSLRGMDIGLVEALAKSLGLSVVFVRTSWPTLMSDLEKRRFDLAASGISITDERRQRGAFSGPYVFDGKAPIARREAAGRFGSLAQIDQPGVRVIVNPGGTNERFVREHVKRATIIVHPDNRTIFDEIIAGRADVMITDATEIRLQERRHPELRGTMAEPLTRAGKAFLLPAGSELVERVDAWLKPRMERGEVGRWLDGAVGADGPQK